MRPDWPSLKRVEAADGSSSLVLQGPSFNRDIPGQILLFTKDDGAAQIAICATVGDVTPLKAALEAESEALDHSKWPYGQRYAYLKAFDDKHGRTFEVVEFRVLQNPNGESIESLRDCFLQALKDFTSQRIVEQPATGRSGYYADTIAFEPHNQDRKYYATVSIGNNG